MAHLDRINATNNPQLIPGPIIRVSARQLDLQVNSFLAVHVSFDALLLNSCDDLLHRNVGEAPQPYSDVTPRSPSLLGRALSNGYDLDQIFLIVLLESKE
jgi:hypothetical protein